MKFSFLVAICVPMPFFLFGQINSDGDNQIWWWNLIRTEINDKWSVLTTTQMRWGDNCSKLFHVYVQPQIFYAPADWVVVGPAYRQVARRFPTNSVHWIPEYIPLLDLIWIGRTAGWKIFQRNRFEYIISESTNDSWLYRNRFRFYTPFHWTRAKITPFFDEEFFWRQAEGINEVRVSAGIQETYTGCFRTEIYYMARIHKEKLDWIHQNTFNISLHFNY